MAKNNTCREFEQIVWLFLDGDMSERERIFWEQHVSSCDTCCAIRDEIRAVELAYHGLPDQEPPEAILSELRNRLYQPGRVRRLFHNLRNRIPGQRL
ncbi:MAG: zf-HC2 domain-containing protein, partial [Candidatus Latescibacteria bacterium]|nr:zf-HC2 domain-containing protein [Candidatus Latescibacterota bacterium]